MQVLRVEEWQSPSGDWRIADTHTWTSWRAIAEIFDTDLDGLRDILTTKYKATIEGYFEYPDKDSLLIFSFKEYKNAHKLKLDVNRIARKKNFLVEKSF